MAHQVIFISPEKKFQRTSTVVDKFKERDSDFGDDECGDLYFYKKTSDYDLGTLYCFGGWDEILSPTVSSYKYDVASDKWKAI